MGWLNTDVVLGCLVAVGALLSSMCMPVCAGVCSCPATTTFVGASQAAVGLTADDVVRYQSHSSPVQLTADDIRLQHYSINYCL